MFGIAWGYLVVKSNSVLPAIFSHYLIDVVLIGPLFVNLDLATNASVSIFFMGITFIYPLLTILLAKLVFNYKNSN